MDHRPLRSVRHRPVAAMLQILALPALLVGCATAPKATPPAASPAAPRPAATSITQEALQNNLMSFADGFSTQVSDVLVRIQHETTDEEVRLWAIRMRLSTLVTASTIAGGPNPVVGLLDMVVFVTLRRMVAEDYWAPALLRQQASALLAAYRAQEEEVWSLATPVLNPEQKDELRELITEWRRANPEQRFVAHVRFADFAAYQTRAGGERRSISSIFQLFAIDPLAAVDPIAAELRSFRLLTERVFYFTKRAPLIASLMSEQILADATGSPDGRRLVQSIETVSAAAASVVRQTDSLPDLLRAERADAVDQLARAAEDLRTGLAADIEGIADRQREAIIDSLASEEERLSRALADVRETLADARAAADAIESAAATAVTLISKLQPETPDPSPPPAEPDRPIADLRASTESVERSVQLIASLLDRLDDPAAPGSGLVAAEAVRTAVTGAADDIAARLLRVGLILIAAAGLTAVIAPLIRQSIAARFAPARRA